MQNGIAPWPQYFCDRLSRLYAVLIAALLLGFVFDFVGLNYCNDFGQYTNAPLTPMALVTHDFSQCLQADDFAANLCFLQTVTSPPFGSNGPLWSLANEWWYYILFPLGVAVSLDSRWATRFVSFCVAAGLLVWLPKGLVILSGVWLIGVAVSLIDRAIIPSWLAASVTVAALLVARLELTTSPLVAKVAIGLGFALLINSMAGLSARLPFHAASFKLADFSYSLYVLHFPFMLFVVSIIHHFAGAGFKMAPGVYAASLFGVVFVLTTVFSWLTSTVTERRTADIRRWSYACLGLPSQQRPTNSGPTSVSEVDPSVTPRESLLKP